MRRPSGTIVGVKDGEGSWHHWANVYEETARALAEMDAKRHAVFNAIDSNSNTHRKEHTAFMRRGTRKDFKKQHPDLCERFND